MKVSLLAGGYPPDLDGIGDYAFLLASALAERADLAKPVTVYTRKGKHEQAVGVRVSPFFEFARPSSIRDLVPLAAEDKPDWLVLQYNPFCWGARGFCPALPLTLRRLKNLANGPKLAVMFHETTVPKWPWRLAIMYSWQRPILRAVARQADAAFVSTKRWIPELLAAGSRLPAQILPVGSNIARSSLSKNEARSRLGISDDCLVLGVFGGAHVSRLLEWIAEAARSVRHRQKSLLVLHVGPEGDVIGQAMKGLPFKTLGIKPSSEVADTLRSMDCLVSPFIDGVSTRRGSVVAALNNGVPVATTSKDWTDDVFYNASTEAVLASNARTAAEFAADFSSWFPACSSRGEVSIQLLHDKHFSWERIADALLCRLRRSME